jgi:hypothetical protein
MEFNATFNNISVISWRSVLLMEETVYPVKTITLSQFTDKFCHIMLYRVHLAWVRFELAMLCICSTCTLFSFWWCMAYFSVFISWISHSRISVFLFDRFHFMNWFNWFWRICYVDCFVCGLFIWASALSDISTKHG